MILTALVEFSFQWDGWLRIVQDGHNIARGPLGLLAYLPLAPLYWLMPGRYRASFLIASSLLLALVTLGPGYTLTVAALTLLGLTTVRRFGTPRGIALLAGLYIAFIVVPQPAWLPAVDRPLYFYLHWAGIGYLFLKTVHVLVDVAAGRMLAPAAGDFIAYLLFAPTLRMGPIYRYPEFDAQLHGDIRQHRSFGAAAIRLATGLLRLGVMLALLGRFPIDTLFNEPSTLSASEFILRLYAAPLSIYLWISGYVDLSIGLGHVMGFRVPDNFFYPWSARNLGDFWRRWHLTLGAWLRDYIYIPLGGNRRHVWRSYTLTFLFCGVWHGLYPSYALWGLSQGVGLSVARSWGLLWMRKREGRSPLYAGLARLRLVGSPLSTAMAWLLTFHYQILTIVWFMDEQHAGRRVAARMLELIRGLAPFPG